MNDKDYDEDGNDNAVRSYDEYANYEPVNINCIDEPDEDNGDNEDCDEGGDDFDFDGNYNEKYRYDIRDWICTFDCIADTDGGNIDDND